MYFTLFFDKLKIKTYYFTRPINFQFFMQLIWCTVLFLWFLVELRCQQPSSLQKKSNATATEEVGITRDYVVWNPSCRIPHFDPYDNSIREYIKSGGQPKLCSHLDPLTAVVFNSTTRRHTLKLNSEMVPKYWSTFSSLRCCFANINANRGNSNDNKYNLSKAICFKNQTELPANAGNIFVYCTSANKKIFKTVYFVTVDKAMVDEKPKAVVKKSEPTKKKYSILLFGISSISKLNFARSFPKTREYIENEGWLPLEGYTKVGENTFSNLVPILTGMTTDRLTKVCLAKKKPKLEGCPFIWKNFSENGYLTSFTEDFIGSGTLNQDKYAFSNSPADFYSQPLLSAAEDLLRKKNDSKVDKFCLGQYPKIEYLFQFNTEFLQRFHNHPYFNLFWINSFDHEDANLSPTMDTRIKTFFEDIKPYLNSTVVIFFSDHGRHSGDIRQTFLGWVEEQMPFVYIHVPSLLKASNSNWYKNLQGNKNKLISSFDLHATLQKLLYGHIRSPISGCPKCYSLFASVPYNRSCSNAAIPPTGCTCWTSNSSTSTTNPPATVPAYEAVATINEFLKKNANKPKRGYQCASLSLSKVTKMCTESVNGTTKTNISFESTPIKAVFEITLPQDIVRVAKVEDIRRISKNEDRISSCIKNDPLLKQFCFCKEK